MSDALNGGSAPETIKATATKSGYVTPAKRRLGPLLRVKFIRNVDYSAVPHVEHRTVRIITRRRVYLLGLSWGAR